MDAQVLGKVLLLAGAVIAGLGAVLYAGGGRFFGFFGRLPGDIRIEGEHSSFYFPIVSCIVLSAVLSLILFLLTRLR